MNANNGSPLEQIEMSMPNGLHDATLYELSIDRVNRQMTLTMGADVSTGRSGDTRIRLRRCRVHILDLIRVRVDAPFVATTESERRDDRMTSAVLQGKSLQDVFPGPLPEGCFAYALYFGGSNSHLYIIARDARLEWVDQG